MKLTAGKASILVVLIILGGVQLANLLGFWQTKSAKVPKLISEGDFAGSYDPGDIRGSYTFADIEKNFDVPAEVLAEAFALPALSAAGNAEADADSAADEADGDADSAVEGAPPAGSYSAKNVEELYSVILDAHAAELGNDTDLGLVADMEIGTDSVRLFTALYTGLPHTPEETTALPLTAVRMLYSSGKIDEAAYQALSEQAIDISAFFDDPAALEKITQAAAELVTADSAAAGGAEAGTDGAADADFLEIKGKTTFADVIDAGISADKIAELFETDSASIDASMTVRDYCTENGLEFSVYKTALQEMISAQ